MYVLRCISKVCFSKMYSLFCVLFQVLLFNYILQNEFLNISFSKCIFLEHVFPKTVLFENVFFTLPQLFVGEKLIGPTLYWWKLCKKIFSKSSVKVLRCSGATYIENIAVVVNFKERNEKRFEMKNICKRTTFQWDVPSHL